jgi:capsular polysaccharide biosynthesis protein
MSSIAPQAPPQNARPMDDDDSIDLRPFILILVAWWREILFLALAVPLLVGSVLWFQRYTSEPRYRARAMVIIARVTNDVNLAQSFQTSLDNGGQQPARRAAYLALATSSAIAEQVVAELGESLESEELNNPAALARRVQAEFKEVESGPTTRSDIIEISMLSRNPELAAAIANSWARHYINHINSLYGQVPVDIVEGVRAESAAAESEYLAAQQAYEAFLATSQIDQLAIEIESVQQLIKTLYTEQNLLIGQFLTAKQDLFKQYVEAEMKNRRLALEQEQQTKSELLKAYMHADLNSKLAIFNSQANERINALSDSYAAKRHTTELLRTARSLQTQIRAAGDAGISSNALAILLLKARMVETITPMAANILPATTQPGNPQLANPQLANSQLANPQPANPQPVNTLPATLQLSVDALAAGEEISAETQLADLAALVAALEAQLTELDTIITEQSALLFNNAEYLYLGGPRAEDDALYTTTLEQYATLFQLDELAMLGQMENPPLAAAVTQPDDSTLTAPYSEMIEQLEAKMQALRTQFAHQTAQNEKLLQKRDQAKNASNTLTGKLVELTVQRTVSNREVSLGSPAVLPDRPVPNTGLMLQVAVAAFAGLFIAVVLAFALHYLGKEPLLLRLQRIPAQPATMTPLHDGQG